MFNSSSASERMSRRIRGTPDEGNPSGTVPMLAERGFSAREQRMSGCSEAWRGHGALRTVRIRARLECMSSDEQSTTGPSEETKRKFREALDRKNNASKKREGESHLDGGGGAQHTQG